MSTHRKVVLEILAVALVACVVGGLIVARQRHRTSPAYVFDQIYEYGLWGRDRFGEATSGSGSAEQVTRRYREFFETLIAEEGFETVVDGGCGDWQFSQYVDWGGAKYLGIDVSKVILEQTAARYSGSNIRFEEGDVLNPLPPADLLIVKDVLQHLTNADIQQFIDNNLRPGRYKIVVLVNDRAMNDSLNNFDIPRGRYRTLDLARPPFNVEGLEEHDLFDPQATLQKIVNSLRFNQ